MTPASCLTIFNILDTRTYKTKHFFVVTENNGFHPSREPVAFNLPRNTQKGDKLFLAVTLKNIPIPIYMILKMEFATFCSRFREKFNIREE